MMLVVCSTQFIVYLGWFTIALHSKPNSNGMSVGMFIAKKSETLESPTSPVRLLIAIYDSGHPRINEEPTSAPRLVDTHQFY